MTDSLSYKENSKPNINLLVSHFSLNDGICNDIQFQKEMFCQLGFSCEIYAMSGEQNAKEHYRIISKLKCKPNDLIIDHIEGYSDYVFALVKQPCRRVLLYHNITPPEFVSNHTRRYCKRGLEQIPRISGMYDFIAGVSQYNIDCLKELGVDRKGDVLPIPVEFSYPKQEKTFRAGRTLNFLFVGRVIQNKRFEDIIDSFVLYHDRYNSNSTLTLVGKMDVAPDYTVFIKEKISKASCASAIRMTGKVSDEELQDIYRKSDVFLCMSEHEGFCIPLLEAMYNGLVVFAYDSTAIGETMGNGGVLFTDKDPEMVAALLDSVLSDEKRANDILQAQNDRVNDFSKEAVKERLRTLIDNWTSKDYHGHDKVKAESRKFIRSNYLKSFLPRVKNRVLSAIPRNRFTRKAKSIIRKLIHLF